MTACPLGFMQLCEQLLRLRARVTHRDLSSTIKTNESKFKAHFVQPRILYIRFFVKNEKLFIVQALEEMFRHRLARCVERAAAEHLFADDQREPRLMYFVQVDQVVNQ